MSGIRPRRPELTEAEVRRVRELLRDGMSDERVAAELGIGPKTVQSIRRGYTYSLIGHLPKKDPV